MSAKKNPAEAGQVPINTKGEPNTTTEVHNLQAWIERVEIGDAVLYLGDSREILPTLGKVDAVVTDPPYGMRWDGTTTRQRDDKTRHYGETIIGDDTDFDPSPFLGFDEVLLWGFNHFPQALRRGTALVWLKRYDEGFGSFLSDAEIAWFNRGEGVYCKRDVTLQGESNRRLHPNQKPVALMEWCIGFVKGETVLDPFMGSGTTGVACARLGRRFIGIEIDPKHFATACKRITEAQLQGRLFDAPKLKAEQISLLGEAGR